MVRIKICGITNAGDYDAARALGVDFVGFVFYKKSPRYVDPDIVSRIPDGEGSLKRLRRVGVFVDEDRERIRDIYHSARLDIVQLHGSETPEFCDALELPCWKAFRLGAGAGTPDPERYRCQALLFDSFHPGLAGGSGRTLDIERVKQLGIRGTPLILAGGISEESVGDYLALGPYAVDVSSSVEDRPGKKNQEKMRSLVKTIRQWERENARRSK
jgi:phosphoribosylanthranilate isomerase